MPEFHSLCLSVIYSLYVSSFFSNLHLFTSSGNTSFFLFLHFSFSFFHLFLKYFFHWIFQSFFLISSLINIPNPFCIFFLIFNQNYFPPSLSSQHHHHHINVYQVISHFHWFILEYQNTIFFSFHSMLPHQSLC